MPVNIAYPPAEDGFGAKRKKLASGYAHIHDYIIDIRLHVMYYAFL